MKFHERKAIPLKWLQNKLGKTFDVEFINEKNIKSKEFS
jgi:hypothetical protein